MQQDYSETLMGGIEGNENIKHMEFDARLEKTELKVFCQLSLSYPKKDWWA